MESGNYRGFELHVSDDLSTQKSCKKDNASMSPQAPKPTQNLFITKLCIGSLIISSNQNAEI